MSPSPFEQRLIAHLGSEPRTATEVWRRFYRLPDGKLTLTSKMRRHRREIGALLQDLAVDRHICRTTIVRHGHELPGYYLLGGDGSGLGDGG